MNLTASQFAALSRRALAPAAAGGMPKARKPRQRGMTVRKGMGRAIVLRLDMEPPTVTHHDKKIIRLKGRGMMLGDSSELKAAKLTYDMAIRQTRVTVKPPLDGPLELVVVFIYSHPVRIDDCDDKPDFDNASKVLCDRLAAAGIIACDQRITDAHVKKRWGLKGMVRVELREKTGGAGWESKEVKA